MTKMSYITQEGYDRLKKKLDQLTSVERPQISRQIADARDKGDLAENAEYHAAKEAQGMLELKISKIENTLANARVIDNSKIDTFTVQLLNRVKIRNTDPVYGGFAGQFMRGSAQMEWTATVGDYQFVSAPLETSSSVFAAVGKERNGIFFK